MIGDFADRLRTLREAKGLTPSQLAAAAGLSLQGVHRLEAGDRSPTFETACKLADALRVSVAKLRAAASP